MEGPGFYNSTRGCMCWERGQGGQLLHGDVTSTGPISSFHTYELGTGRSHTGSVNTAFQLLDVDEQVTLTVPS